MLTGLATPGVACRARRSLPTFGCVSPRKPFGIAAHRTVTVRSAFRLPAASQGEVAGGRFGPERLRGVSHPGQLARPGTMADGGRQRQPCLGLGQPVRPQDGDHGLGQFDRAAWRSFLCPDTMTTVPFYHTGSAGGTPLASMPEPE